MSHIDALNVNFLKRIIYGQKCQILEKEYDKLIKK